MGVDQKRPLVGFALVAVLCAILMGISIEKSSGIDLFKPGKPIAAPSDHRAHQPVRERQPEQRPKAVSLPAELSVQPVGAASGALVRDRDQRDDQAATGESTTTTSEVEATRKADKGEKAVEKADREAAKAARKAEREAAKAVRKAEREAAKAAREAERAAATAARDAAKAAAAAERDAAKVVAAAERDAADAVRDAEKLARKAAQTLR